MNKYTSLFTSGKIFLLILKNCYTERNFLAIFGKKFFRTIIQLNIISEKSLFTQPN